ncbi:TIGR03943 family protein [Nonomuraea jabiensis]|uniref:TIGR03943 family putative permease subunit n=1 Tax=Nonomuraea jabiensis TaxID=882448 RepID=UPI00343EA867
MRRQTQGALLLTLGATLLSISAFSATYVNYVRPGFRPLIIAAGVVLAALGLLSIAQEWLGRADAHGTGHGHRVAWLLAVPVFALVLIAPPALGSFAAGRDDGAPAPLRTAAYRPLTGGQVTGLTLSEFIGRAYTPSGLSLAGTRVRLTGFVTLPRTGRRWYVTRMRISCCAADAFAMKVAVEGAPAPKENSWVEVTGTWIPWKHGIPHDYVAPAMTAATVTAVEQPAEPYE